MVMRIHNTGRWNRVKEATPLDVSGELGGAVRMDVNTSMPTLFEVLELAADNTPRVTLIGVVFGLETLDFYCEGPAQLVATGEADWFYALPGDGAALPEVGASFTRIMKRKERNHALEMIEFKMRENERRRDAKMAAERAELTAFYEGKMAAERAAAEAAGAKVDEDGVLSDDGDGASTAGAAADGVQTVASAAAAKTPKGKAGGDPASA